MCRVESCCLDSLRPPRKHAFLSATIQELRVHAILLALVLWTLAAVLLAPPGRLDAIGRLKGRDFAYFYTLGTLVTTGQTWRLYDMDAEHQVRAERIPESAADAFPTSYPPQIALVFAPLSLLAYGPAFAAWFAFTILAYFGCAALFIPRPDWRFWWPVILAFPPLWHLTLGGQSTAIPLIGFALGTAALLRGRLFAAGLAFGLLAVKPQFGIGIAAVLIAAREWRVIAGIAIMVGAQIIAATFAMGPDVFFRFARIVLNAEQLRELLQARPELVHSLVAWTDLLPRPVGGAIWLALVFVVLWRMVKTWLVAPRTRAAMTVVILGSALVSPHLNIYDVTVLVLPLVWLATDPVFARRRQQFGQLSYALFVALLLPTALIVGLQLSVATIGALFWLAATDVKRAVGP